MDVYNAPGQGLADMYLIQGTESTPQFTGQFEQFEAMYNKGAPEYYLDQGIYYPPATSYGYGITGFESMDDWEDHNRSFSLDRQDVQYTDTANDSLSYLYYTPNYGYGQSPYNPYNPFIPGAVMGFDGSYVAPQQYYALSPYENPASLASYVPMVVQPVPDAPANRMADLYSDNSNHVDGLVARRILPSSSPNTSKTAGLANTSSLRASSMKVYEGNRTNAISGKQPVPGSNAASFSSQSSSQILQARGLQGTENGFNGKASVGGQLKTPVDSAIGVSGFESSDHGRSSIHKLRSKLLYGMVPENTKIGVDAFSEQDRGRRTNISKNQLSVKALTTRAGNPDVQGNIVIFTDQYNSTNFPVDYVNAKFFVIKSYSEDDVHKSIKYNVWSSTPNGNKKLNAAYEDAQRIAAGDSRGCPIFLFFSVNASGQFCGVAEMIGPVDFHKDMDFWQQDKWSGSFPVKWHIIKDLPNPNFRHIILENNENKPVTNSRDTQEIPFRKGLEMLRISKNHTSKTSLLDDFLYYENRQRILHEERARMLIKSYENPYLAPLMDPPRKLQSVHDFPSVNSGSGNVTTANNTKVAAEGEQNISAQRFSMSTGKMSLDANINHSTNFFGSSQVASSEAMALVDELKISSLSINSKGSEPEGPLPETPASTTENSELIDVVTIGSMPIKVKCSEPPSGILTVGTIPLDPRALQHD